MLFGAFFVLSLFLLTACSDLFEPNYTYLRPRTEYVVWFNAQGGRSDVDSQVVSWDSSFVLPVAARERYCFDGWYCSPEYGEIMGKEGDLFLPAHDDTLFAYWTFRAQIMYESDGTSSPPDFKCVGEDIEEFPTSDKDCHIFLGWFDIEGEEKTPPLRILGDTTLFARFEIIKYTITFNVRGGTAIAPLEADCGKSVRLLPAEREDYLFLGWFDGEDEGAQRLENEQIINSDLTVFARWRSMELADLRFAVIDVLSSHTFNGAPQIPEFTVMIAENQLVAGTHFTAIFTDNINAGNAEITINAIEDGGYIGVQTASFVIEKADPQPALPTGLTATFGDLLSSVVLPSGWAWEIPWETPDVEVGNVGQNSFEATFTHENTNNFNVISHILSVNVNPAIISSAALKKANPTKGQVPANPNNIEIKDGEFTVKSVVWYPDHPRFLGGTEYSAVITLAANENFAFCSEFNAATINETAVNIDENSGAEIVISHKFAPTYEAIIVSLEITQEPSNFNYAHGEQLDLSELRIRAVYSDYSESTLLHNELHFRGVVMNVWHNNRLSRGLHNNLHIIFTAILEDIVVQTTGALSIVPRDIANVFVEDIPDQEYTGSAITPQILVNDDEILPLEFTENYFDLAFSDNVNAGTASVILTGKNNYSGEKTQNFVITPATPTVITPPTATSVSAGQTLATSTLSGGRVDGVGGAEISGTWAWLDDTHIINENGSFAARFIPTSQNYSEITVWDISVNLSYTAHLRVISTSSITGFATLNLALDWLSATPVIEPVEITISANQTFAVSRALNTAADITLVGDGEPRQISGTFLLSDGALKVGNNITVSEINVSGGNLTLAQNAVIETVRLTATHTHSMISVESGFTGNVPALDLAGGVNIEATIISWEDKQIITPAPPHVLTENDVARFTLRNFVNGANTQPITQTHLFSSTDLGRLVSMPSVYNATITVIGASFTFNGNPHIPDFTVGLDSETLLAGTHFSYIITNNVNAGAAEITITGLPPFIGTKTQNFTINPQQIQVEITNATLTGADVSTAPAGITLNLPPAAGFSFNSATNRLTYTAAANFAAPLTFTPTNTNYTITDAPTLQITGTAAEPILVNQATIGVFNAFAAATGHGLAQHYRLTENVVLDGSNPNNWTIIGSQDAPFRGVFDGNGHSITNMSISSLQPLQQSVGMFANMTAQATVRNLALIDIAITIPAITTNMVNVGGIVGVNIGTIENVFVSGNITGLQQLSAGGIVGMNEYHLRNSFSTVSIALTTSGQSRVGGIAGYSWQSSNILNCIAIGQSVKNDGGVHHETALGRVVGLHQGGTLVNNRAWSGMSVARDGAEKTVINDLGNIDGLGTLSSDFKQQNVWTDFDFTPTTGIWIWEDGKMPRLRNQSAIDWATWFVDIPQNLLATFGDLLSSITLPNGWTWVAPTLSVGDVGARQHTARYNGTDHDLTVVVSPALPTVATPPTATSAALGHPLSNSIITGIVNGVGGATNIPGTWAWKTPAEIVNASGLFEAVFTPASSNYLPIEREIQVAAVYPVEVLGIGLTQINFTTLAEAFTEIRTSGQGTYTITLNADQELGGIGLDIPNVNITILGEGRTIQYNGNSFTSTTNITLHSMFAVVGENTSLTLGRNLTLRGLETGAAGTFRAMIFLSDVSDNGIGIDANSVVMEEGSRIINHFTSAVRIDNGIFTMNGGEISGNRAVAVLVDGGTFTMNGGEIRGNIASTNSVGWAGGIEVHSGAFNMNGGRITDNVLNDMATHADARVSDASIFTLSGNAQIGNLQLADLVSTVGGSPSPNNFVIQSGWSGNISTLNLTRSPSNIQDVINIYQNRTIIRGSGAAAAIASNRITLGNFIAQMGGNTQPIYPTAYLDTDGVLRLNLVSAPVVVATQGVSPDRGFPNLQLALNVIQTEAGNHTITLRENQTIGGNGRTINTPDVNITIIGDGTERTISHALTDPTPAMLTINNATASLTLGNNITIQGRAAEGMGSVVLVSGGTFNMENGSKITGHNLNNAHSTVQVNGAQAQTFFNMNGGEITGNSTTFANSDASAGVSVINGTFNMQGGSITDNRRGAVGDNTFADVFSTAFISVVLNNNARIGTFMLNAHNATTMASINIGNNFAATGGVDILHLHGNGNMETTIDFWTNAEVLRGNRTPANIAKFPLGNFRSNLAGDSPQAINETHFLNDQGRLERLPAPVIVNGTTQTDFDNLTAAFEAIRLAGAGTYTITLNADQTVGGVGITPQTGAAYISIAADINITLIGAGGMREIQFNGNTEEHNMFRISANAGLTLENNITLRGTQNPIVQAGLVNVIGTFTMESGSIITGHISPAVITETSSGAPIFTMNGGEIRDNVGNNANFSGIGVYITRGTFNMNGGRIFNNTFSNMTPSDVSVSDMVSFTLSGNAQIGDLRLADFSTNAMVSPNPNNFVIQSDWTGMISTFNLTMAFQGMGTVINSWNNRQIIKGTGAASAITANKIPLGNFVAGTETRPISPTASLGTDGVLRLNPALADVMVATQGAADRGFATLQAALNEINTEAGNHTITVRAPQNLANRTIGAGQNITIEGAAQITLNNATQRMFTVNAGGNLTIGGDITINGHSSNSGSLILVQNGTLTVRDNAIITGHTTTHAAGAIDITENSTMNINGGSITGNSPLDALATGTVNISGTAQIGNLTLNIHEAHRGSAAVNAAFDGSVASLNLRRNVAIMNDVVNSWQSQQVISGTFASAAISAGKFGLGNFVSTNNTQPIDETHFINDQGVLVLIPTATVSGFTTGEATREFPTLELALAEITAAGTYIITLFEDQPITATRTFNVAGANITLTGDGTMREIRHAIANGEVNMFTINNATTSLTLGNNITIRGRSAVVGSGRVISIENGEFVMETGSIIRGHTNARYASGAVHLDGATAKFTMKGGLITENRSIASELPDADGRQSGAGLTVLSGEFTMTGGIITGNTRGPNGEFPADVHFGAHSAAGANSVQTLDGNARIGALTLNAQDTTISTTITVGANFTGNVESLNLRGGNTPTLAAVRDRWTNRQVLVGNLTSETIAKFTLGNFIMPTPIAPYPIDETHTLAADGRLITHFAAFQAEVAAFASASQDVEIVVERDIVMAAQINIPGNSGRTLTIKSANPTQPHTLSRGFTDGTTIFEMQSNAHLIVENIIIDGGSTGAFGSGVVGTRYLMRMEGAVNNATFEMRDGAVLRNNFSNNWGSAIRMLGTDNRFIMRGGEIYGNTANERGAVNINAGTFEMTGGSITNNRCSQGGVLIQDAGNAIFGGNAVIRDNTLLNGTTPANLNLNNNRTISLSPTTPPTSNMEIHLYGANSDGVFVESGANAGHVDNFFADNSDWNITHDNGQLVLLPPPSPVSVSGFATGDPIRGFDNLDLALNAITTAGTYTITLNENLTVAAEITLNTAGADITLTGGSTMRTITHNITTTAPSMFTISGATTSFTLGDNITVQGRTAGGGGAVVNMTAGTFNMQGNSRIQGHNVSGVPSGAVLMAGTTAFNMSGTSEITNITSTTATSAAVYVTNAGAVFTMSGGSSITGNTNTLATAVSDVGAGVSVINGQFNMNGGSITGNRRGAIGDNTAPYADVYIGAATFVAVDLVPTLNNNAQIGTLTLNGVSNNTRINIGDTFNGNVQALNLRWNDNDMATVISRWTASSVVVLAGNFAPHIPMFNSALALGQFVSQTNDREAIAPRVFNANGGLQ